MKKKAIVIIGLFITTALLAGCTTGGQDPVTCYYCLGETQITHTFPGSCPEGWSSTPCLAQGKIQKYLCFIGYNSLGNTAYQEYVASHFDAAAVGSVPYSAYVNIMSLNPSFKVYRYKSACQSGDYFGDWNYVSSHEDWFMHSKYGSGPTERIYEQTSDGKVYIMDPSSGWADYYRDNCVSNIVGQDIYYSIHADNAFPEWDQGFTGSNYNYPDLDDWNQQQLANWGDGMIAEMANTRAAIQKKIIANTWKWYETSNASGAHEWEHFVHGPIHDLYAAGYSELYTIYAIERMKFQASHGIELFAISGTKGYPSSPTQQDQERLHQLQVFTLCCFLFTVSDLKDSYYTWCTNSYRGDPALFYFPEMDIEFGSPVDQYHQVEGSLYMRTFTNRTVYANISPTQSYVVEGTTLIPRSGLIL